MADPIVACPIRLIPGNWFSGGPSEGETPVPIPNTAVKLLSADGTAWATAWESRSPPGVISIKARETSGSFRDFKKSMHVFNSVSGNCFRSFPVCFYNL